MNTPRIFLLALLCLTPLARAQDLTPKAPPQSTPIAITGVTIHPVSGPPVENAAIVFDGGIIKSIQPMDAFDQSKSSIANLKEISAKGRHVWPGLIGVYTQLGLTEISAVRSTIDESETGNVTPEVRACIAVNPDSTLLPVTRANGELITGVFPTGGLIPGRASVMRLDGWTVPDMTIADDAGVILRWPNVRPISAWWMDRSEEEQLREIRRSLEALDKVFDAAQGYALAKAADAGAPTDLRWEAMRAIFPAPDSGAAPASPAPGEKKPEVAQKPLFVFASDIDQINSAVAFCLKRHLHCVIIGGRDAPACAELLTSHDIPVIVSGTFAMPRRSDSPYDDAYALPAKLFQAHIRFAIASGEETAYERNLPYAAGMAVAHGLPHDEAVKAITINAAQILNVGDRYGSLEPGKSATLILTTGSPLEVTTRIERAFIDGRDIDLSSKQTKLAEKYRERYRQTGDLKK